MNLHEQLRIHLRHISDLADQGFKISGNIEYRLELIQKLTSVAIMVLDEIVENK